MNRLLQVLRNRRLQPLWQILHRSSLVGMNYWSSLFAVTGEQEALSFVAGRLKAEAPVVIFDVGANVGEYSLACLELFQGRCELHSFEPSQATFDQLEILLSGTNAQLHKLAFSDRDGTATLHTSEPGSSIASLEELERPLRPFVKSLDEEVPVTTIDRFCDEHGIAEIHLLKLDIEGHELSALHGARRMIRDGRIKFLQFEFGENNISSRTYLADFDKLLSDRFLIFRIVPGGLVPWSYEGGRSEIFATMNYLCERKHQQE